MLFILNLSWIQMSLGNIVITNADVKYNAKFNTVNISVTQDDDGVSVINAINNNSVIFNTYQLTYTLQIALNDEDQTYQQQVLKSTMDACKLDTMKSTNFIIKIMMTEFNKYADFQLKCPFPKGVYKIVDLKVNAETEKVIPSFMLRNVSFLLRVDAKGKIPDVRNVLQFYSLRIYGKHIVK